MPISPIADRDAKSTRKVLALQRLRWVVGGTPSLKQVADDILQPLEAWPGRAWWVCFLLSSTALLIGVSMIAYLIAKGIGIWGENSSVSWAFDITNFVFWIGIGHAGTLISAILLLFRQQWRTSINRFAEAMTLFAVACAAMFPLLHTGRPWLAAYWLFPYPNTMTLWPQFRSPLIWDVFAVSTYGTVSALFWFTGLVPDMATLRDRAKSRAAQTIYGMMAL